MSDIISFQASEALKKSFKNACIVRGTTMTKVLNDFLFTYVFSAQDAPCSPNILELSGLSDKESVGDTDDVKLLKSHLTRSLDHQNDRICDLELKMDQILSALIRVKV